MLKDVIKSLGTTKAPARSESSPQAGDSGVTRRENESQQWEVVTDLEEDQDETNSQEQHSHARKISSQAEVSIGWGRWKFKLFSWDVSLNRHSRSSE